VTKSVQIIGWGKYLPTEILTNQYFEDTVDTTDEWIRTRTGVLERRRAHPKENTSGLATKAAWQAMDVAGVSPEDIDLILMATITPDYVFPGAAYMVQDALGASHAAAFDLNAGCSGFVYGMVVASDMIRAGSCQTALVIGAEILTRITDYNDRSTCVLFGDGAGAVVLQASEAPGGVLASVLGADGSGGASLQQPAGGSRHPASRETVDNRLHYIKMNGNEVYRFAVSVMSRSVIETVRKAGLRIEDIDLIIPHQANSRIIQSGAKSLGVPIDKMFSNLHKYGNTSAASVPVALCEAVEEGRIRPGSNVVLVAFGAGLSWAALALQWGPRVTVAREVWWKHALRHLRNRRSVAKFAARRVGRQVDAWWPLRNGEGG
jgi:3-oxoacyl-[acyl-carrier-protein] synthase III